MKDNLPTITLYFSLLFVTLASVGFISDLCLVDRSILKTSLVLDLIYLVTAVGLFVFTKFRSEALIYLIRSLGLAYLLISFIGFQGMVLHINYSWSHVLFLNLINYLHFGLGMALCFAGTILNKRQRLITI